MTALDDAFKSFQEEIDKLRRDRDTARELLETTRDERNMWQRAALDWKNRAETAEHIVNSLRSAFKPIVR